MGRKEDEIEKKLAELEAQIVADFDARLVEESEKKDKVPAPVEKTDLTLTSTPATTASPAPTVQSDLYVISGLGLIVTGILLVFSHIRVSGSLMTWLGLAGHGFGFILIPLLVGIGMLIYNHNNRVGWLVTAASLALIMVACLSQLVMTFPSLPLLGLIIMLLPFAAGGALLLKGLKARKAPKA